MNTIRIQPPTPRQVEIPNGKFCKNTNASVGELAEECYYIYAKEMSCRRDDYFCKVFLEEEFNMEPLNDSYGDTIWKCPACLAACAEAEKKGKK